MVIFRLLFPRISRIVSDGRTGPACEQTCVNREEGLQMKKYGRAIREYVIITLAVILMDIGIYVFKFPNNFSFGGISGLAVVITPFLPFTASQINLFFNGILLAVGFLFLGKDFGVKTAYVTVVSSLLLNLMEALFPMSTSPVSYTHLTLPTKLEV